MQFSLSVNTDCQVILNQCDPNVTALTDFCRRLCSSDKRETEKKKHALLYVTVQVTWTVSRQNQSTSLSISTVIYKATVCYIPVVSNSHKYTAELWQEINKDAEAAEQNGSKSVTLYTCGRTHFEKATSRVSKSCGYYMKYVHVVAEVIFTRVDHYKR